MGRFKVVIHTTSLHFSEKQVKRLQQLSPQLDLHVVEEDEETALDLVVDADVLVSFGDNSLDSYLEKGKRLKWIHLLSPNCDAILTPTFFLRKDLMLTTSSTIVDTAIAEHVLLFMLMFSRDMKQHLLNQNQCIWSERTSNFELTGKKVAIVGVSGSIGVRIAQVCEALGMAVTGVSINPRRVSNDAFMSKVVWGESGLMRALAEADFVISVVPANDNTKHLFNEQKFQKMKSTSYFINVGRGAVVDEQALLDALKSQEIAGAGLDVFEVEPLPAGNPLWKLPNVVITPHTASQTSRYMKSVYKHFRELLTAYITGATLPHKLIFRVVSDESGEITRSPSAQYYALNRGRSNLLRDSGKGK